MPTSATIHRNRVTTERPEQVGPRGDLRRVRVTIVTYPYRDRVGEITLQNFLRMFPPKSTSLRVVSGAVTFDQNSKSAVSGGGLLEPKPSLRRRIFNYLLAQVRLAISLYRISSSTDLFIFHIGMTAQPMPILAARARGKHTVLVFTGALDKTLKHLMTLERGTLAALATPVSTVVQFASLMVANKVAVQSEAVVSFAGLNRWRQKLVVFGAIPVDTKSFRAERPLGQRREVVGYVGRLSPEKGVVDLIDALPTLLEIRPKVEVLFAGEGPLEPLLTTTIANLAERARVRFIGWINHDELPDLLNNIKVLILPSRTEGLPAVLEEAMACGTIVVATAVGGVPDIISDGSTGFLLEGSTPSAIASKLNEVLQREDLETISHNAQQMILTKYSLEVKAAETEAFVAKLTSRR